VKQKGASSSFRKCDLKNKTEWIGINLFNKHWRKRKEGDHTSLSCVSLTLPEPQNFSSRINGILGGTELAEKIFHYLDASIEFKTILNDGDEIQKGQIAFELSGHAQQSSPVNACPELHAAYEWNRHTHPRVCEACRRFKVKILDTRKTTPLFRAAGKVGGKDRSGENHRFGCSI